MYDDMVTEYEILDRIEALNQQLDYAQATMQSLKDDAQHEHSTFLEYTIVLLIGFEVLVEMHALGWVEWPDRVRLLALGPSRAEREATSAAASSAASTATPAATPAAQVGAGHESANTMASSMASRLGQADRPAR